MDKMSEETVGERLKDRPEWSASGDQIQRTFQFDDFVASMRFVTKLADAAEAAQHHPDILIRYNKVTVTLSTHDAGGITEKDFSLAAEADAFALGVAA